MKALTPLVVVLLVALWVAPALAQVPVGPDPGGAKIYEELKKNSASTAVGTYNSAEVAANTAWTLATAALVWFMQAGFAFLGAGAIRSKNQVNYWTKSYIDFSVGIVVFMVVGFAFMFGGHAGIGALGMGATVPGLESGNPFIGTSGFLMGGDNYDPRTATFMVFQAVFAATAVTIVAGMVIERMKFQAYLLYSILISILIYPIYGHWVWSANGWLANLSTYIPLPGSSPAVGDTAAVIIGARDFAGSGVVHAVGGFVGLAGAMLVGPRIGKYGPDGKPRVFPGHNVPYVVIGTFILFLGWFGFNPGSTLAVTDPRTSIVFLNTYLAGGMAATVMAYLSYFKTGKADTMLICNGALGGLVAITAPCAYVAPWAALVIGAIAGILVWKGNTFIESRLKVDDPVGAWGVHGANGLFGLLAVGIFADGKYGGVSGIITGTPAGMGQLIAQIVDIIVVAGYSFGVGFIIFYAIHKTMGLRVSAEEEMAGLDVGEHGYSAYPEFTISASGPEITGTPAGGATAAPPK
ncbi:MAG: ammonium transporter [Euryarchaeota archaeon]|nr:ammonium transporter [Euryarchaeota archaeon]